MRFLKYIQAFFALLLVSCATTSQQPKPYDFCICGPTFTAEGKAHCAIWGDNKNPAQNAKVWVSEPRPSCEPKDCSELFSGHCEKIQMSGLSLPVPQAPVESCFCDAVLLENDRGQVTVTCAAWAENGKNLIEYYALEDCSPQRCAEPPFSVAPKLCNNSFKPFYVPLLNKR